MHCTTNENQEESDSFKSCANNACPCHGKHLQIAELAHGKENFRLSDCIPDYRIPQVQANETPFEVIKSLGEGSFGSVELVRDPATGSYYALKKLKAPFREHSGFAIQSIREIRILKYIRSEYQRLQQNRHAGGLSGMEEWPIVTITKIRFFEGELRVGIFFEYLPYDLHKILSRPTNLQPDIIAMYVHMLLHGVAFLHHCGIAHRDIKPSNILLGLNGSLKIADFGMAREWRKSEAPMQPVSHDVEAPNSNNIMTRWTQVFGTVYYRAPESFFTAWDFYFDHSSKEARRQYFFTDPCSSKNAISVDSNYAKYDLWSVGCVIAEMFTGKTLFRVPKKGNSDVADDLDGMVEIKRLIKLELVTKRVTQRFLDEFLIFCRIVLLVGAPGHIIENFACGLRRFGLEVLADFIVDAQSSEGCLVQYLTSESITPIGDAGIDFIRKLLRIDSAGRLDAMDALEHAFFHSEHQLNQRRISELKRHIQRSLAEGGWHLLHNETYSKPNTPKVSQEKATESSAFAGIKRTNTMTAWNPYGDDAHHDDGASQQSKKTTVKSGSASTDQKQRKSEGDVADRSSARTPIEPETKPRIKIRLRKM